MFDNFIAYLIIGIFIWLFFYCCFRTGQLIGYLRGYLNKSEKDIDKCMTLLERIEQQLGFIKNRMRGI